jgi:protein-L-isoaspartate O-methyltransferase
VVGVEIDGDLAPAASARLASLGCSPTVAQGDETDGYPAEEAPRRPWSPVA